MQHKGLINFQWQLYNLTEQHAENTYRIRFTIQTVFDVQILIITSFQNTKLLKIVVNSLKGCKKQYLHYVM